MSHYYHKVWQLEMRELKLWGLTALAYMTLLGFYLLSFQNGYQLGDEQQGTLYSAYPVNFVVVAYEQNKQM